MTFPSKTAHILDSTLTSEAKTPNRMEVIARRRYSCSRIDMWEGLLFESSLVLTINLSLQGFRFYILVKVLSKILENVRENTDSTSTWNGIFGILMKN